MRIELHGTARQVGCAPAFADTTRHDDLFSGRCAILQFVGLAIGRRTFDDDGGANRTEVIAAIRAENQDLPAGSISRAETEQLVRVEGRIKDPRGFERIIVANQGGAPVYLGQVADIVDGEAEEQSIARVDGMRSVSLSVYRAQQANLVKVGAGVEEPLAGHA